MVGVLIWDLHSSSDWKSIFVNDEKELYLNDSIFLNFFIWTILTKVVKRISRIQSDLYIDVVLSLIEKKWLTFSDLILIPIPTPISIYFFSDF